MSKMEENVADPSEVNKELSDYIEARETKEAAQTCTGKKNYTSGAKTKGQKTSPPERQIPMYMCPLVF